MCDQQPIQCCLPLPQCCVKGPAFRLAPAPYANSQVVVQAPCEMQVVECPAPCPVQVSEVKCQAPCQPKTTEVKSQAPCQPKTTEVKSQAPCQAQTAQVTCQAPCQAQTAQVTCQPEVCYVQYEAPGPVQTYYVDRAPVCYTETCYLQYPVQTYAPQPAAQPVRTYMACPPAFQTQGRFSTQYQYQGAYGSCAPQRQARPSFRTCAPQSQAPRRAHSAGRWLPASPPQPLYRSCSPPGRGGQPLYRSCSPPRCDAGSYGYCTPPRRSEPIHSSDYSRGPAPSAQRCGPRRRIEISSPCCPRQVPPQRCPVQIPPIRRCAPRPSWGASCPELRPSAEPRPLPSVRLRPPFERCRELSPPRCPLPAPRARARPDRCASPEPRPYPPLRQLSEPCLCPEPSQAPRPRPVPRERPEPRAYPEPCPPPEPIALPAPCPSPEPRAPPRRCPSPGPGPAQYVGDLGCQESRPYHLDGEAPGCGAVGYNLCGESGASYRLADVFPEPRGLGGYADCAGAGVGVKGGAGAGAKGAYF
ncbi:keratinocyte proline-rich protein [Rousettus aegyptiacus]|uniref:keratinocyte proline-rich protein n=1 Tax=Rousettus aegyptiacus TaxID=9407 RepID=UPI00168CB846|nr:keratinocyte proline-rich protein [Rousettus aegyptiacus]